ncbi:MAG: anhydro-N-acetylmuramic acid kinase, partial [Bacteroidia bacterium]|nr:anhydro-N-acetylmuramic acid kinase [Bacteroidia bacterium]
ANIEGQEFDKDGSMAHKGKLIPELLTQLNNNEYYKSNAPKSVGVEWFNKNILPIIDNSNRATIDLLHTSCIHISEQIATTINKHTNKDSKVLITGGGTLNLFLVQKIKEAANCDIIIPSTEIINFKEAIIFAFMGVLRKLNIDNVLSSVTGSTKNHCAGIVYCAPN